MIFTFTAKNGTTVEVPEEHINGFGLEDVGYCLACGEEHPNIEPDARLYPCDDCEKEQVFGAQELLIMGCIS